MLAALGFLSLSLCALFFFFFFQAEDGIRDLTVTGVQTCALPILPPQLPPMLADAMQVEQALFNLCTNAMHALGERRGLIQMDADLVRPDQRLCERLGLQIGRAHV